MHFCVHECSHVLVHVNMCVCMWKPECDTPTLDAIPQETPTLLFESGSLTETFSSLGRAGWTVSHRDLPVSISPALGLHATASIARFSCRSCILNLGPRACMSSTYQLS